MVIPPNANASVDLDMGQLVTAYVHTSLDDSSPGSKISYLYSECYYQQNQNGSYYKGVRDDYQTGALQGDIDVMVTDQGEQDYEPFFMRTFRFLRLTIQTGSKPLVLRSLKFRLTGYPLDIQADFYSEREELNQIWDISRRTLLRCMQETYMDCPYYEQLQYVMDTMIEAALTYCISPDHRLARKALYDFHSTQLPNGLIYCKAPTQDRDIIPGFAIYYIDMIYQYCSRFSDIELLLFYLPDIQRILNFFKGYLDERGLLRDCGYWEFVDWTFQWEDFHGVPPRKESDGCHYIYTLMYAYALKIAAQCYSLAGWQEQAGNLIDQQHEICEAANQWIRDPVTGLYRTEAFSNVYSQHAQIWAVLSECVTGTEAEDLMKKTLASNEMVNCSYPMMFYYFRALEHSGMYSYAPALWKKWTDLLPYHLTTWVEDPASQRSDCHAWSAVPIYEIFTQLLGVQESKDVLVIDPQNWGFGNMNGRAVLSDGGWVEVKRSVAYQKDEAHLQLWLQCDHPRKLKVILHGTVCAEEATDKVFAETMVPAKFLEEGERT